MDKGSFPFDISDVAMLLNLNIRSKRNQRMDVDCPICGEKRGKTTIYLDANVFRCHHCGEGGGMIILYAKTYGISNSDAYREICDTLGNCRSAPNYTVRKKEIYSAHGSTRNSEPAALNVRHQTYSMLFSSLTLSKTHKQHLINRGLTTEQIEHYGFKSTPAFGCANIVRTLLRQGSVLHGVPGFYTDELGEWAVKFSAKCTGIVIPVTTINGCVAGAQIRLDNPSKGCKYIWFSSVNEKDGASSGSPIGFAGDPAAETVYITEGYLKAVIAHSLSGKSFAGVAGANQKCGLANLFEALKRNGTRNIVESFDMDKYSNEQVEKGCLHMCDTAKNYGFAVHRLKWNPEYKRVDDYLRAIKKA